MNRFTDDELEDKYGYARYRCSRHGAFWSDSGPQCPYCLDECEEEELGGQESYEDGGELLCESCQGACYTHTWDSPMQLYVGECCADQSELAARRALEAEAEREAIYAERAALIVGIIEPRKPAARETETAAEAAYGD